MILNKPNNNFAHFTGRIHLNKKNFLNLNLESKITNTVEQQRLAKLFHWQTFFLLNFKLYFKSALVELFNNYFATRLLLVFVFWSILH